MEGKVENAAAMAFNLGRMIYTNANQDIESRTMDIEAGKMIAEDLVKNYFDNPEEAKAFMAEIEKYAQIAEKGSIMVYCEEEPSNYKRFIGDFFGSEEDYMNSGVVYARVDYFMRFAQEKFGFTIDDWDNAEKVKAVEKAFFNGAVRSNEYPSLQDLAVYCKALAIYDLDHKSWLAEFPAKEKEARAIIDNAKTLADPSQSVRANYILDLLKNWALTLAQA